MVKYCPFRKRICLKDRYQQLIHDVDDQSMHDEEFLVCLEDMCMAYEKGECLLIKKKRIEEMFE